MTSEEIRKRFLDFFAKRGHAVIPSAPLVPLNDPSVLFNTAGMQPLVPYLLGQKHPKGARLANSQKCVRTVDIDEVGDNRHLTFFEMLGNWSLGDYFKEEAIAWSYEFLTSKDEGLGLDPAHLYVTVFAGDDVSPRDDEAASIWKKYMPEDRIYYLPAKNNWWSPGDNGPCGPDTEIFYDLRGTLGDMTHDEFVTADDAGKVVEIWNNVFMTYEAKDKKIIGSLKQQNIDTGMGLERIVMVAQGVYTVFETDFFAPVIEMLKEKSKDYHDMSANIVADHFRTALMMSADGVIPANKNAGYIMRRLIRRGWSHARHLSTDIAAKDLVEILDYYALIYKDAYPEISAVKEKNYDVILGEIESFGKTLEQGLKEFEKGEDPFILATTYGFPIELTVELAKESGRTIDMADFEAKMKEHQKLSQTASAGMFKGGLANHNEKTIRLHTAHHLLLSALQEVLGKEVKQRGSNITEERLRIDFSFDRKMTDEEKKRVEEIVNARIEANLNVIRREMPREEAEKIGAEMEFGVKYPDTVSVYFIEEKEGSAISKEFCGGPHVANTGELGHFKLQKEEASSQGVRRIKAVLE
ncbi:MAG: alanine--tRNA ligase [Candidatus Pacebacteria bacterium]|nr:alanine--tRNA ligase [Candidatus Paceibacterota bacterium]